MPVNTDDINKSLSYVLFYQAKYFFLFVVFVFICMRVRLTIVLSLGINTPKYNLSAVGGTSILT